MNVPLSSTVVLLIEILIGAVIFRVVAKGYRSNRFPEKLAVFAIAYEVIFNVGYMVFRAVSKPQIFGLTPTLKIIAAFHGILSLLMLAAVVAFFLLAGKNYREGRNYFRERPFATFLFLFFWAVSLLSGIYLYLKVYF